MFPTDMTPLQLFTDANTAMAATGVLVAVGALYLPRILRAIIGAVTPRGR